ncbi:MAG: helix-turn-helix domain-containing protein [Pseudomonadota bacterium]
MKLVDIAEVCERSGLPPSTLRYYEEIGLVESVARHGLRRQFGPEITLQLALISLGRSAGFSLGEIGAMFARDGVPKLPRDALHAKADDLDAQIKELTTLSNALRHVADCPAPSHMECPRFRKLLNLAKKPRRANKHIKASKPA